jgi:hypothetical protein
MRQEFDSLQSNDTWLLVDLPLGHCVVNNTWIYKAKTNHLGHVSRFKSRFVGKGDSQKEGAHYTEILSHVIRMVNIRVFLAISATMDLDLFQMDTNTTFTYAPIKEDVYVKQPLGFLYGTTKVCHLERCLYGFKQSLHEFNEILRD